jgi:hypothetical protein
MGRKHKNSSIKYIKQNLMQENKNLVQVNESLRLASNYATVRDIESRKKIVELEKCNRAMMEIMRIQKEANDFQQQKIEILETQLSLLNNQEKNPSGTLLKSNQEINSFGSALMLACSVKINNIKSEDGEINGDGKIKICEEGED